MRLARSPSGSAMRSDAHRLLTATMIRLIRAQFRNHRAAQVNYEQRARHDIIAPSMISPQRRFPIALLCGCLMVVIGIWLSSGTMAPYAITHAAPKVLPPCSYLANPDHPHFEWVLAMLDGQPREVWE